MFKDLEKLIDKNFEQQVEFLKKLVQTKSANPYPNPQDSKPEDPIELAVAKTIKSELEKFGIKTEFVGVSGGRPNVVAEIKGQGNRTLIFNGHMDTVMPSRSYTVNPFGGEIRNGKLYGVGAADMKASLASFVYLAAALVKSKPKLKGKVIFTFVVDEESGACSKYGTAYLLEKGLKADAAIVAEPGTTSINNGHRGGYRFKLTTFGEPAHTGLKNWEQGKIGKNAIIEMQKATKGLENLAIPFKESATFPQRRPVFTFPTMIKGGSAINVVPDRCEAFGDVRLMPGNTKRQIRTLIEGKLNKIKGLKYKIEDLLFVPAFEVAKNEKIIKVLLKAHKETFGSKTPVVGAGPWNDAWMFLERGIPTVCGYGPDGGNIHGADEFVDLESMKKVTKVFAGTVLEFFNP